MLMRLALAALAVIGSLTLARADGLTPAGTAAQGLCYASGTSGPRVPCVLQGQTWTRVLRPTDPADGMTVGGTALPSVLGAKAPLASPTFSGTVTAPDYAGDGSAIMARGTGSGAIARSLASRLRDEVNVLDRGATGDCTTDDAPAINAAWLAGKGLFFPLPPGGCYLIKSPLIPPDTASWSMRGLGQGVSIIRAGAAMSAMLAKGPGYMFGARITALTFDGDARADYVFDIARMAGATVTGNDIMNARVANLRLGNGVTPVQNSFFSHNNFMNHESKYAPNTQAVLPDYNILILSGATDNQFTDNIQANAKIANIKDASSYGQNFFLQNHAYGYPVITNYAQYCFWSLGGSQFTSNEVDGCSVAGYRLDGDNTSVIGSHFQWPEGSVGDAVGVQLASGASYNVVANNKVLNGHISPDKLVVQLGTPGFGNILTPNAGATDTANQSQGRAAKSSLKSAFVRSNGYTYNPGDRQEVTQILFSQTTDMTPKRLTADGAAAGAANTFNIPQYQAWVFSVRATCRGASSGGTAMWYLDSEQITRGDQPSSTALTGGPTAWTKTRTAGSASSWSMTYAPDTINSGLALTFTGAAGDPIACHAIVTGLSGT